MNSANRLTLLMFAIAAVAAAIAMVYYPWPETAEADAEVGKPLFEEHSADQVRGIDVIEFNSDRGSLDRIKLIRRAEKWVVPSRQNFIATNSPLIGSVVNALNDREVFEVISENQQDHIKFGVVDPTEYAPDINVRSLGRKLILSDRNSKPIASLIVGSAVKNESGKRHYARVPGKPRVYTIDFDKSILTTEFAFWISPNALQLQMQPGSDGQQFRSLVIDSYRIRENAAKATAKKIFYRAAIKPSGNQLAVESLLVPGPEEGDWKRLEPTPEQLAKLNGSALSLFSFFIDDVRPKSKNLAAALRNPAAGIDDKVFAELLEFGFAKTGFENGSWQFSADEGEVSVGTREGVLISVLFGKVGGVNSRATGILNRYVMFNAAVDTAYLPEPKRPPGLADDESEQNRDFRRLHNQWEQAVKEAKRRTRDLNAIHGDWLYLISDDVINSLRPEIPLPQPVTPAKKTEPDPEESDPKPSENDG